jgi:hypothetical protein
LVVSAVATPVPGVPITTSFVRVALAEATQYAASFGAFIPIISTAIMSSYIC